MISSLMFILLGLLIGWITVLISKDRMFMKLWTIFTLFVISFLLFLFIVMIN